MTVLTVTLTPGQIISVRFGGFGVIPGEVMRIFPNGGVRVRVQPVNAEPAYSVILGADKIVSAQG